MLTKEENKKEKVIDVSSETKTVSISELETEMSDDPKAAQICLMNLEKIQKHQRKKEDAAVDETSFNKSKKDFIKFIEIARTDIKNNDHAKLKLPT